MVTRTNGTLSTEMHTIGEGGGELVALLGDLLGPVVDLLVLHLADLGLVRHLVLDIHLRRLDQPHLQHTGAAESARLLVWRFLISEAANQPPET